MHHGIQVKALKHEKYESDHHRILNASSSYSTKL